MENIFKNIELNKAKYLCIYCIIYFILFSVLFYSISGSGDLLWHLNASKYFAETGKPYHERFGYHLLVVLVGGFSKNHQALTIASIIVLTSAVILKALFSIYIISRESGFSLAIFLSVIATFVAPITLSWSPHPLFPNKSPLHLGQISGFIIHNPTTITVFPLSLLLFYFSYKERYVISSLLAAFSCIIKPNFVLAWGPAFVLLQFWRYKFDPKIAQKTILVLLPAILVLTFQFLTTTRMGDGTKIMPLVAWRGLSNNIPMSIWRSIAFPLMFICLFYKKIKNQEDLWFAWLIFLIATTQYSLFVITGRPYNGNWSWGRYLAIYNVFLLSLARFAHICFTGIKAGSIFKVPGSMFLLILILLHFLSGVCYYARGVLFHET